MTHLTPELLDALLDGSLEPNIAGELRRHLEQPCDACQQVLVEHNVDIDGLLRLCEAQDALADDDALDGAAPLSVLERDAIWRSVEGDMPVRDPAGRPVSSRPWWRLPAGAAVVVVAMAAAVLLFVQPPPDPTQGLKGAGDADTLPAAPTVELRVVTGREVDGKVELDRRVHDGERLARDLFLLFEIESDRLSARYLFVVDGAGKAVQLSPAPGRVPELEPPGSGRIGHDGSWVVLDLADMQGPLTLVGAASALAADPGGEVVAPFQAGQGCSWVAYDSIVVELAP